MLRCANDPTLEPNRAGPSGVAHVQTSRRSWAAALRHPLLSFLGSGTATDDKRSKGVHESYCSPVPKTNVDPRDDGHRKKWHALSIILAQAAIILATPENPFSSSNFRCSAVVFLRFSHDTPQNPRCSSFMASPLSLFNRAAESCSAGRSARCREARAVE